ncbi:MAG TPA: hypothetical protein ENI74_00550 [Gammaproteobacteria bacterium]|nr:hypothetical protein [Gammaproteobacteria bacterium]
MSASSSQLHGYPVIREVAKLLDGLEFTTPDGTMVRGDRVRITIDPRWEDEAGAYRVLITCYVLDGQHVDWASMPVRIRPAGDTTGPTFIARLNPNGQAVIKYLPRGQYNLSSAIRYCGGDEPIIYPPDAGEQQVETLAAAAKAPKDAWPEQPTSYVSNDTHLVATPELLPDGRFAITFESTDEALDKANIEFAFVSETGQVEFSDHVVLSKAAQGKLWLARWEGAIEVQQPCRFIFSFQ